MMDSIFKSAWIACLLTLAACGGDSKTEIPTPPPTQNPQPAEGIQVKDFAGEWHLTQWSVDSEFGAEVYLRLDEDLTFVLYQNIVSHGFRQFPGTFSFDAASSVVSGRYDDGTPWGYSYAISDLNGKTMKWTAIGTNDVSTYTRETIPELRIEASRAESAPLVPFL